MHRPYRSLTIAAALAAFLAPAALAHHSYVSKYDSNKVLTLSGTVKNVRFANPHIFFELEAGSTTWTVETESLPVAQAAGLTEKMLAEGTKVSITGWPDKEKAAEIGLKTITFPGGKTLTLRKTAR